MATNDKMAPNETPLRYRHKQRTDEEKPAVVGSYSTNVFHYENILSCLFMSVSVFIIAYIQKQSHTIHSVDLEL